MDYALYNENVWDSVQGVITLSHPIGGVGSGLNFCSVFRTILNNTYCRSDI